MRNRQAVTQHTLTIPLTMLISIAMATAVQAVTVTTNLPTDDTYVSSNAQTTTYGNSTSLEIKQDHTLYTFFRWDLSALSKNITNARLYFNVGILGNANTTTTNVIYLLTNYAWTEETLTWQNQPAFTTNVIAEYVILPGNPGSADAATNIDLDVTDIVREALTNEDAFTSNALAFVFRVKDGIYNTMSSKEDATESYRPRIVTVAGPPLVSLSPASVTYTNEPCTIALSIEENYGYVSTNGIAGTYIQFDTNGTNFLCNAHTNTFHYYGDNGSDRSETNTHTVVISALRSFSPAPDASFVPIGSPIVLAFNFNIANTLGNMANIAISNETAGTEVAGTWTPGTGTNTNTITFTPSASYGANQTIRVYVNSAFALENGESVEAATNASFTTGLSVTSYTQATFTGSETNLPAGLDYPYSIVGTMPFSLYISNFSFGTTNITTFVTNETTNITYAISGAYTASKSNESVTPTLIVNDGVTVENITLAPVTFTPITFDIAPTLLYEGIGTEVVLSSAFSLTNHIREVVFTQGATQATNPASTLSFTGKAIGAYIAPHTIASFTNGNISVIVRFTTNNALAEVTAGTLTLVPVVREGVTLTKNVLRAEDTTLSLVVSDGVDIGDTYTANIADMTGKRVMEPITGTFTHRGENIALSINTLPAGTYLVQIRITGAAMTKTHTKVFIRTR